MDIYQRLTIWKAQKNKYNETFCCALYDHGKLALKAENCRPIELVGQFVPAKALYYFESADGSPLIPEPEDFILRGDQTAFAESRPMMLKRIKKVGGWDMSPFGVNEVAGLGGVYLMSK